MLLVVLLLKWLQFCFRLAKCILYKFITNSFHFRFSKDTFEEIDAQIILILIFETSDNVANVVLFWSSTKFYHFVYETVCVLKAYECVVQCFLKISWHVREAIKSNFKSICTRRIISYDVTITVFCSVIT